VFIAQGMAAAADLEPLQQPASVGACTFRKGDKARDPASWAMKSSGATTGSRQLWTGHVPRSLRSIDELALRGLECHRSMHRLKMAA
jgi:hypothetical protein